MQQIKKSCEPNFVRQIRLNFIQDTCRDTNFTTNRVKSGLFKYATAAAWMFFSAEQIQIYLLIYMLFNGFKWIVFADIT